MMRAPNYANIFIEKLERNFINLCLQILSNFCYQFIDDLKWKRDTIIRFHHKIKF